MGDDSFVNRGNQTMDHLTIREWMAAHLMYDRGPKHDVEHSALWAVYRADALLKALHPEGKP